MHDGTFDGSEKDDRQEADKCDSIWVSAFYFFALQMFFRLFKMMRNLETICFNISFLSLHAFSFFWLDIFALYYC